MNNMNKNSYRIRIKVCWCRDSILQKKFWKFIPLTRSHPTHWSMRVLQLRPPPLVAFCMAIHFLMLNSVVMSKLFRIIVPMEQEKNLKEDLISFFSSVQTAGNGDTICTSTQCKIVGAWAPDAKWQQQNTCAHPTHTHWCP